MCTLSVLPGAGRCVVVMNRDESRERPLGGGLRRGRFGEREGACPVDRQAGGTWFGVNDAGLVLALLNHHPAGWRAAGPLGSRGHLVPGALAATGAAEAVARVLAQDPRRVRPFRFVALEPGVGIQLVVSDGRRHRVQRLPWGPFQLASSSWQEARVQAFRAAAFRAVAGRPGDPRTALRALHRSHDGAFGPLGHAMQRPDARTVSLSEAEVDDAQVVLRHLEAPPHPVAADHDARLAASAVVLRRVGRARAAAAP